MIKMILMLNKFNLKKITVIIQNPKNHSSDLFREHGSRRTRRTTADTALRTSIKQLPSPRWRGAGGEESELFLPDDKHRYRNPMPHRIHRRSKYEVLKELMPMCSHHQQVGVKFFDNLRNPSLGIAVTDFHSGKVPFEV